MLKPLAPLGARGPGVVVVLRLRFGVLLSLEQAKLGSAGWPLAPATTSLQGAGASNLFLTACLVRIAGATEALPGGQRELDATVVAVAGVDSPVAARFALCKAVPDATVSDGSIA